MKAKFLSPYWLPVWFFAGAILIGAVILHLDVSHPGGQLSFIDALFTTTSAMCVTGLAVVDTGSYFSTFGQDVILVLIQLGGLGIMTFTTLIIYLLGRHVSLTDRIAVGQTLLRDPSFSLPKFLTRVVVGTFIIEAIGALCLWLMDPVGFHPYSAIFHSISAFCNAGFSLYPNSLTQWAGHGGINMVFMALIIAGGLGFVVLNECGSLIKSIVLRRKRNCGPGPLSWHASIVLRTSFYLIAIGAVVIFFAEELGGHNNAPLLERIWVALFQSVTCRTAGFNTVDISGMTNVSLAFMMFLMLIGGSPGSTAGGIKTTTFRALISFIGSQFKGRQQIQIGRYAMEPSGLHTVISLVTMAMILIWTGTMVLTALEGSATSSLMARDEFMLNMFESISAFATVGLSTGITSTLDDIEKITVIILMFIGRLGPVWLLSALQSWQTERRYKIPEAELPLG